ncbi:MAG: alpha amylase C-terminal domain-containing protein [Chloroflexi bacterium]|nr:alpha amylase C-terminal domain-containing protein [Chloroflexota bacterium]
MGVTLHGEKTTFRVWAPHADGVFVTGSFNSWSPWRTPLASEGDGLWSVAADKTAVHDTYKFLIHHDGQTHLRADPYARAVSGPHLNGVVLPPAAPPGESFELATRHELVIYELHVGTFNVVQPHVVGQFQGVMEKLPYLAELGVNAIEIMPVAEFAGDYSWGYNPAFPFAITHTYGGREALQQLVAAAHAQGIGVIVDVVYNHFGPQDLSLWQFDGWHEDGQGGIYFYNDWRAKTPWADTRPDYGRAEVRQFIRDNVFMWFEEFGVDGLRWDATNFIRNAHGHDGDPGGAIAEGWQLMQAINAEVQEKLPGKLLIAEDLQNNTAVTLPAALGGLGFAAQWDAQFVHPIRQAVITPLDEAREVTAVAAAISARYGDDPWSRILYTESHDEVANGKARVPEEISSGQADSFFAQKRSTLGAVLLFTTPGIPMIFQGQEFLESGWFDDHVPLDWRKAQDHNGILRLYRELIGLRRNLNGQTQGLQGAHVNVFNVNNTEKIIAYHRWLNGGPGDDVIVVANLSHRALEGYTIGLPRAGRWKVRFNSDDQAYGRHFTGHDCPDVIAAPARDAARALDGLPCLGNVTLAPYSALILSQDRK